uniref:Uncharacterized protein n=1 Tax=Romanomermis culicivorax TaxID=13658 RepID=A0A915HQ88_ROMCU
VKLPKFKIEYTAEKLVSETGVEAAAASALDFGVRIGSSEPSRVHVHFRAKDPFFFYITMKHEGRLNQYESVLFAGQYATP